MIFKMATNFKTQFYILIFLFCCLLLRDATGTLEHLILLLTSCFIHVIAQKPQFLIFFRFFFPLTSLSQAIPAVLLEPLELISVQLSSTLV